MSEAERRTGYVLARILIDASRILSPQFGAQGIYLNGAQVELLRNVVAYLRRDTTFVDEYHPGYYLRVTSSDFDDIQAIVADLEDKLANNDNVLWGFFEGLKFYEYIESTGDASTYVPIATVPAGEVWVPEVFTVWHNDVANRYVTILSNTAAGVIPVGSRMDVPTAVWYGGAIALTLTEGDILTAQFDAVANGKGVWFRGLGYKMKVPE